MNTFYDKLPVVIILSGQSTSNVLRKQEFQDAISVGLYAPAVITDAGHTFLIQVTDEYENLASAIWSTMQIGDPAADAVAPGAGKARQYLDIPLYAAFRIKDNTGNTTADTTWRCSKLWGAR